MKTLEKQGISAPSKTTVKRAKAAVRTDAWAELLELKVDAKKFSTRGRKYIIAPLRDNSDEIVVKKAAQMGFTIGFILKTLHNVTERHWNGMYVLPFKQGARTFVQSRIDPILASSKELSGKFSNVANVLHKQTDDDINLYIRGTNVATDLREVPVDFEIWDERDKFVIDYLGDALSRMDGSPHAKLVQLSTPTAPGLGVDSDENWRVSDQCKWEIPCPHCNRFQVLEWDTNVKVADLSNDYVLECSLCHKQITDEERWEAIDKGRWVPTYLDASKRGYHVSQLYSPTKRLSRIFRQHELALSEVKRMRDFTNLVLGEPYAGKGDKFDESLLDRCRERGLHLRTVPNGPLYIGVDQGAVLHCKSSYVVKHKGVEKRVTYDVKIFRSWNDLRDWLHSLHNFNLVIDAHPEKTKAKELAYEFKGRVWLGLEKDRVDHTELATFDEKKFEVSIDRTMAFDQYIWDHERGMYAIPANARELGETMPRKNYNGFYSHHMEMVKVPMELADGKNVVRWVKTRNPDHWHHAGMFELIAMQRKPKLSIPISVQNAVAGSGGMMSRAS